MYCLKDWTLVWRVTFGQGGGIRGDDRHLEPGGPRFPFHISILPIPVPGSLSSAILGSKCLRFPVVNFFTFSDQKDPFVNNQKDLLLRCKLLFRIGDSDP